MTAQGTPPHGRVATWAECRACHWRFVVAWVPLPLEVFASLLKAARCPACGATRRRLLVYEPGATPPAEHP